MASSLTDKYTFTLKGPDLTNVPDMLLLDGFGKLNYDGEFMLNRLKPTTTKPRAGDQNLLRNLNVSYIPCDVLEEELVHNNFYYYLSFQFLLRYSIHDKINFSRMFRNFFHNPHKSCDLMMTVTKNINLQKTLKIYTCLLIIFLH